MSTRRTLWFSDKQECSLYEETLEAPLEINPLIYPVHFESTSGSLDINVRLPDDLSIQLVKARMRE